MVARTREPWHRKAAREWGNIERSSNLSTLAAKKDGTCVIFGDQTPGHSEASATIMGLKTMTVVMPNGKIHEKGGPIKNKFVTVKAPSVTALLRRAKAFEEIHKILKKHAPKK